MTTSENSQGRWGMGTLAIQLIGQGAFLILKGQMSDEYVTWVQLGLGTLAILAGLLIAIGK